MESPYELLRVPKESANDDSAVLVEWLCDDGAQISEGSNVCTLETSKATFEFESPRSGWLFHLRQAGDDVRVGEPFGLIAEKDERPETTTVTKENAARGKVTRKAQKLIQQYGLDVRLFDELQLVREDDVRRVLEAREGAAAPHPDGKLQQVTVVQRRVAATLEETYRKIPHSCVSCWIEAAAAERRVEQLADDLEIMASLSDLLVYTVARQIPNAPKLNAAWKNNEILLYNAVNVGFALNLENGDLFVPIIRDADRVPFDELVARIRGLQKKAKRKQFVVGDLTGGTVTVTSLIGSGIHQVMPLVVPGQSAIISIADKMPGPAQEVYCLTLAFDHRVVNGAEAAGFLSSVAKAIVTETIQ